MTWKLRLLALAAFLLVLPAGLGCQRETTAPGSPEDNATAPADDAASGSAAPEHPPEIANEPLMPETDELPDDVLVIWAEGDPDVGPPPLTVKFTVDPIDDINGGIWEWDFGDNSAKSDEQNPTHTYDRPGAYTARVKVTDASGTVGTDEVSIEVEIEETETETEKETEEEPGIQM